MGRYYETATPNFVEDFIYQPPWEMAMAAMAKQEQNVQTSLDTMEVMRNLPINYWKGVDDERANQVKTEWESKINDLSKSIGKDLLNPDNRAKLMQLKSELNKDVMSGNIAKLQDNANAYQEFEAKRQALKNPADRDMYLKQIELYKQNNPNGAYSGQFKADEMYDTRNWWEEYASSESFKAMNPDVQDVVQDSISGAWLVKTSKGVEALTDSKVGENFKVWLKNQTDLPSYAKNRQTYNNEAWLGEDGNISLDQGTMGGDMLLNGVKSLAYTKSKSSSELDVNQVYENNAQRAFSASESAKDRAFQRAERIASENAARSSGSGSGPIIPPEFVDKSKSLIKVSLDLQEELNTKFGRGAAGHGVSPEQFVRELISKKEYYAKKYPQLYKEAVAFNTKVQNNRVASKQIMVDIFGKTQAEKMQTEINKSLSRSTKVSLPLADGTTTGKRYNLSDMNAKGFVLDGFKVKPGTVTFGSDISYIPGSSMHRTTVMKPVNFQDEKGIPRTTYVYLPMTTFIGEEPK